MMSRRLCKRPAISFFTSRGPAPVATTLRVPFPSAIRSSAALRSLGRRRMRVEAYQRRRHARFPTMVSAPHRSPPVVPCRSRGRIGDLDFDFPRPTTAATPATISKSPIRDWWRARARASRHRSRLALAQAKADRRAIAEAIATVEAWFKPLKQTAYDAHRALCDREHDVLDPLKALDKVKAAEIREYHDTERRERRRQEAEAAEAARRDRETAAAEEAARFEAAGDTALAEAIVAEAIAAPAPVVVLPDPTAGVVTFRRVWKWKYAGGPLDVSHTLPETRARALARLPPEFLMADEKKIGSYVRSMKGSGAIPALDILFRRRTEPLGELVLGLLGDVVDRPLA